MNKKGAQGMVLRDLVFLLIIFSGIIALASIIVNDVSTTYDNTNMTAEYNQDSIGEDRLQNTSDKWKEINENLNGNLLEFLTGTFQAAKEIITQVIKAPITFGNIIENLLNTVGVSEGLSDIIGFIITGAMYILIAFALISAFLQGGKL